MTSYSFLFNYDCILLHFQDIHDKKSVFGVRAVSATLASGLDFLLAFYNDHCRERRTVVELRW